jgi:Na+-transporting methylmalonyl-CoA/oxaloacetate decarboxylase gamma subunit
MNEVLQTNIFLGITGVAVIIITLLVIVLLVYGIKIFRDVSHISHKVKEESEAIVDDVRELRNNIKESSPVTSFFSFFAKMLGSRTRKTRTKRSKE